MVYETAKTMLARGRFVRRPCWPLNVWLVKAGQRYRRSDKTSLTYGDHDADDWQALDYPDALETIKRTGDPQAK